VFAAEYFGASVALKTCPRKLEADAWNSLVCEVRILRGLRHPNIIPFYGLCVMREQIHLVEQLCEGFHLADIIEQLSMDHVHDTDDTESILHELLLGIASALAYLHTRCPPIVHGDVKPTNIMVAVNGATFKPLLLDFGLTTLAASKPKGGSWQWAAPELLLSKTESCLPSSDVFSFGMIMHFVITGHAHVTESCDQLHGCYETGKLPTLSWRESGSRLQALGMATAQECLHLDPASRPSCASIVAEVRNWNLEATEGSSPAPKKHRLQSISETLECSPHTKKYHL